MKTAYVFPGQGSQFTGMGQELYVREPLVRDLFDTADSILGFGLREIMFTGTAEDLKATKVTQPILPNPLLPAVSMAAARTVACCTTRRFTSRAARLASAKA